MSMLIRRSVRGGLQRRASATLLPASRQTEVIPSLAASFLSSSAAGAAARIRGSPIRSKGQCIYRMLCDGSGSTQAGHNKPKFLAMMKGFSKEFVKRHWTPMCFSDKLATVGCVVCSAGVIKTSVELIGLEKRLDAILGPVDASLTTRRDNKKKAA